MLGLGMATASFAGGVETAEAKAEVAPKECVWYYSSCNKGVFRVCSDNEAAILATIQTRELILCGSF